MGFGDRADAIRRKKGLSYAELGRRAGVSSRYVRSLLRGERVTPSAEIAAALAKALDVSLDWLMELPRPDPDELAADEVELLRVWRQCQDERIRQFVLNALRAAIEKEPEAS